MTSRDNHLKFLIASDKEDRKNIKAIAVDMFAASSFPPEHSSKYLSKKSI